MHSLLRKFTIMFREIFPHASSKGSQRLWVRVPIWVHTPQPPPTSPQPLTTASPSPSCSERIFPRRECQGGPARALRVPIWVLPPTRLLTNYFQVAGQCTAVVKCGTSSESTPLLQSHSWSVVVKCSLMSTPPQHHTLPVAFQVKSSASSDQGPMVTNHVQCIVQHCIAEQWAFKVWSSSGQFHPSTTIGHWPVQCFTVKHSAS